jgi:pimeloyl-ACP methyl ester carboxylesterase
VDGRDVEFHADDGVRLAGTLTTPAAGRPVPVALLLSGSGPLDRDSNMPGQVLDVGSALAAGLAAHGVGSLRFDKRGVGASAGNYLRTGFEQETRDAGAALEALRRMNGIDGGRVAVIGHSAGATIAARLAGRSTQAAGAVLLSVSIRPGLEVMRWQSERIAETLRWPSRLLASRFLRRQERVRRRVLDSREDLLRVGRTDLPARWLREYMTYDPEADLRALRCPVLAITGRKDVQVDPDDVARLRAIVGAAFMGDTPDELTHLLRQHPGPPGLGSYRAQLEKPVDPALVDRVAAWTASIL